MTPPYRYILRYQIDPVFHAEDRIEELALFCRASGIDEVLLFHHAEELTPGHPTREQCRPWLDMAIRLKQRLARDGVELSLHSWSTTHHTPRGRRPAPGQNFTTMVGPNGVASLLSACPLCPNWQAYIAGSFAWWAGELKPRAIWIEDDWRLHNHGAELGFGGCFCDLHLRRFAQSAGRDTLTLEELVEALTAPGAPHPWRGLWLDLWRASLLEPAIRIRDAVRAADPDVRMGLMTSDPDTHSIEGRDWHAMQQAWGFEPEFLVRPHLPPYTETNAKQDVPAVTRHTIANLRRPLVLPRPRRTCQQHPHGKLARRHGGLRVHDAGEAARRSPERRRRGRQGWTSADRVGALQPSGQRGCQEPERLHAGSRRHRSRARQNRKGDPRKPRVTEPGFCCD